MAKLDVGRTALSGTVPWVAAADPAMAALALDRTRVSGVLPNGMLDGWTKLTSLEVDRAPLSGTVPSGLSDLTLLQNIEMGCAPPGSSLAAPTQRASTQPFLA
jgi:hypothetical protein